MQASDIRKVTVVGAGLMGHGIALELAANGYPVRLHDLTDEALDHAVENIHEGLDRLVELGVLEEGEADEAPDRIWIGTDLAEMVSDADLVIEAVAEDPDIKKQVFADLGRLAPDHAILASNTSSFMPSIYADESGRPEKVVVTHYANPPHFVPLVEIVPGPQTSEETVRVATDFMERLGKKVIVARREVPGFILNRLQLAILREALWLIDNDVADAGDIDDALKYGTGRRWAFAGPFEVFDLADWRIIERAYREVAPSLANSGDVPKAMMELLERGHYGAKAGQGFHKVTLEWLEETQGRIAYGLAGLAGLWADWEADDAE